GKNADAIAGFKAVRDKYPNSEQAQQASFYIGQILYASGDAKTALTELDGFVAKFPQSELVPQALYFKARALTALGKKDEAQTTYAKVASEFPKSQVAAPSFFERAIMLRDDGKSDEAIAVMKEFAEKFPDSPQVYQAFEFIAQIQIKDKKVEEAIKTYESYIASHADNPTSAKALVAIAKLQEKQAEDLGSYLVIAAKEKPAWESFMQAAVKTAETAIEKYPESDTVAAAVEVLLDVQRSLQVIDPSKSEAEKAEQMKGYFTNLAKKYEGTPAQAKISFGYAALVAAKDEDAAFETMKSAYNPEAVFSPEDLDHYGKMLITRKQYDEAGKIAAKLEKDYPVAPNTPPEKVTRTIGTAQSIAMSLRADILRANGKAAEGQKILEKLKQDYPWSPKVAEANFGIAAGLFEQGNYDEAVEILIGVARENNGPVPLRARAMMMTAKALEAQKKYGEAINNYTKISAFFQSERDLAAEGLWRGAQLQEKQGTGEIPMPEPAAKKPAAKPEAKKSGAAQTDGDKKAPKKP
ncbi:MAG: tetratricopeptide repeat protein, partial [Chthoniobacteraceae bacterium]